MPVTVADVRNLAESAHIPKNECIALVLYANRNPELLKAVERAEALEYLQQGLKTDAAVPGTFSL